MLGNFKIRKIRILNL